MNIQSCLPLALYCLHNIIHKWDPEELADMERKAKDAHLIDDPDMTLDILTDSVSTGIQCDQMGVIQDEIAADLWASYLKEQVHRRDYGVADNIFDPIV